MRSRRFRRGRAYLPLFQSRTIRWFFTAIQKPHHPRYALMTLMKRAFAVSLTAQISVLSPDLINENQE